MIQINLTNDLVGKVKKDALARLVREPENYFYQPDSELKNLIAFLYADNVIKQKELETALEAAILQQAKNDLSFALSPMNLTRRYADLLPMPEILAYAIDKKIFSKHEEESLPLGHRAGLEEFCHNYKRKDLLGDLMRDLMNIQIRTPYAFREKEQAMLDQLEADIFVSKGIHF